MMPDERIKKLLDWLEAKRHRAFDGLLEACDSDGPSEVGSMRSARYCTMLDVCAYVKTLFPELCAKDDE